jgi:hypothetical protein
MSASIDFKYQFAEKGYVVVPDLMTPEQENLLREASTRVIEQTRAGKWPHRRVVGRQFPPYTHSEPDSWGVQHVMHPELHEPAFANWYTSDALVRTARELLGCSEDELQMGASLSSYKRRLTTLIMLLSELFNLLINPTKHEFALRWHRDDVRETADEEEEIKALALWHHGVSSTENQCV